MPQGSRYKIEALGVSRGYQRRFNVNVKSCGCLSAAAEKP
jgi:hypothetical protein